MVPWANKSALPSNGMPISLAVFLQLIIVTNTQTDRRTYHAMCVICSNRPHLCTACISGGSKRRRGDSPPYCLSQLGKKLVTGRNFGVQTTPKSTEAGLCYWWNLQGSLADCPPQESHPTSFCDLIILVFSRYGASIKTVHYGIVELH